MNPHSFRLEGRLFTYVVFPWWDLARAEHAPFVRPTRAELRDWLEDPGARAVLVAMCEAASTHLALGALAPDALLAATEAAFERGELRAQAHVGLRGDYGPPGPQPTPPDPDPPWPPDPPPDVTAWLELEALEEGTDAPVANARYVLRGPSGATREGRLDARGFARIEGLDPGAWEVTFPDLDAR